MKVPDSYSIMKAVILAAGSSSRFRPLSDRHHKGLTEVLGKPIIQHTVEALENIGIDEVIIVQGPGREFEDAGIDAEFVVQEEPNGMGDALDQARGLLDGKFLVLNPYHAPSSHIIERLVSESENGDTVFVCRETDTPEDYGILEFDTEGHVIGVEEKPENPKSSKRIVGMYLLNEDFFQYLDEAEDWEYGFEDALAKQVSDSPGRAIEIDEKTASIKYPWDLLGFVETMIELRGRDVSDDAEIADSAELTGDVIVEPGAKIYENAVIKGPAYVGRNAVIGNNAVLRDSVAVEENAVVGANSEVKNSVFQPESSIHSGFVGDSVIGRNTRIGAGTIIANRNFRKEGERPKIESDMIGKEYSKQSGRTYLGAFIGEDVDIGVNVSIMPGVQIGSNARIGPGTILHENVDEGETVYVNQDQVREK